MAIKFKNIVISRSIIKNSLLIASVMLALYVLSIFFSINLLRYYLTKNLDSRIRHEIEHISSSIVFRNNSFSVIRQSEFAESDLIDIDEEAFLLQIYSNDGKLFLQSENLKKTKNILKEFPVFNEPYFFKDINAFNKILRVGYQKLFNENGEHVGFIQLAIFKSSFSNLIQDIFLINLITFPLVVLIILLISFFISKKTFSPINKIISLAQNISALNLNERLNFKTDPDDELGRLKDTLNDLFDRLEIQFRQISEFSDNASHQLMTPLTAIKTEIEYLLNDHHEHEKYTDSLLVLKEQTERMIKIIRTMLLMAKSSVINTNPKSIFNLSKVINHLSKTSYKNYNIELDIQDEIYLRGNQEYFILVLQNLIDNALKFSNSDVVSISAHKLKNNACIEVKDLGIGIDKDEFDKIFERFYRSEKAESLGIRGTGLGLSLVQHIVKSMNGSIHVKPNNPKGTIFIITIPIVNVE